MSPAMRSQDELQRAHDLLHGIVLGEVPVGVPEADRPILVASLDVLCWALRHDHNPAFAENLATFEEELARLGYVLEKRDDHDPR